MQNARNPQPASVLRYLGRVCFASLACISITPFWLALADKPSVAAEHSKLATNSVSNGYVGDTSCSSCHAKQASKYEKTAHRLTLQLPTRRSILGKFDERSDELQIVDPATSPLKDGLAFKMHASKGRFYETSMASEFQDLDQTSKKVVHTERIDLVTGAGVHGQSYLYWKKDQLYELPISYWTDGSRWINSPGYPNGSQIFDRPVYVRCLECHTTYIKNLPEDIPGRDSHAATTTNRFMASTLIAGITCEKCHGPGAQHVALEKQRKAFGLLRSPAVLNPKTFSRDRQMDLCALCHDGTKRQATAAAFSYTPGQPLDDFFAAEPTEDSDQPEIHGNQVGLLKRSRCYRSSPAMSCSTCHNEHAPERPAEEYSARCLSCHTVESCGAAKLEVSSIEKRCIDCHMPLQTTNAIVSVTAATVVHATIRTHWIKVYH